MPSTSEPIRLAWTVTPADLAAHRTVHAARFRRSARLVLAVAAVAIPVAIGVLRPPLADACVWSGVMLLVWVVRAAFGRPERPPDDVPDGIRDQELVFADAIEHHVGAVAGRWRRRTLRDVRDHIGGIALRLGASDVWIPDRAFASSAQRDEVLRRLADPADRFEERPVPPGYGTASIEWTNTLADWIRLRKALARPMAAKLVARALDGAFVVTLVWALLPVRAEPDWTRWVAPVGFGLAGLLVVTRRFWVPRTLGLATRIAQWRDPGAFPVTPIRLAVGPAGFYATSDRGAFAVGWDAVTAVQFRTEGLVISVLGQANWLIPQRAFASDAAARAFAAAMNEAGERARGAARGCG